MCTAYVKDFLFLLQHQYLTEALHWRAQTDPDHVLFVLLNAKVWSWPQSCCFFFITIVSCKLWDEHVITVILLLLLSSRGQQWAQQPACSFTSARRRLPLLSQRKAASTLERMWCCSIHPVSPATVFHCVYSISGNFFHSTCVYHLLHRHRFDRCLLWLSLRWMRSCKCQTSTPSEPCSHPAHCPHDNWCMPLYSLADTHAVFYTDRFCFFQVSKAACILTTQHLTRILRSKEAATSVNIKTWPTIIDTGMCL